MTDAIFLARIVVVRELPDGERSDVSIEEAFNSVLADIQDISGKVSVRLSMKDDEEVA